MEKNLRYQLIPFRHIHDQRILQSDWTKSTTAKPSQEVVPGATFAWWLSPYRKSKRSDCLRGITSYTKQKVIVSDAAFLWWLSPSKKSKMSIGSFQKYWWLKNAAIWLAESILDHNWRTRLFTNMRFLQDHNEDCHAPFLG